MINHLTLQSEGRDLGSLTDSWTLSNVASVYPIFARVWFHRYLVPLVSDPFGGSAVCFCFLAYQTICFELSILGSTNTLTTIQLTKFCCHCLLSSLLSLWVLCPWPFKHVYSCWGFWGSGGNVNITRNNFLQPLLRLQKSSRVSILQVNFWRYSVVQSQLLFWGIRCFAWIEWINIHNKIKTCLFSVFF